MSEAQDERIGRCAVALAALKRRLGKLESIPEDLASMARDLEVLERELQYGESIH